MIKSKKINIIVVIAMLFALIISITFFVVGNIQASHSSVKTEPAYATKVFGTDIISIEILADEQEWQEMLENAINEQYIMADVIVNGTKFQKVGIRPKGNSSLTQVANSDSNRYSFRLQFNEYIKGQTCFGLESFVVNNMLGDNTYMKEYVSYDLMKEIGVDGPYYGYADIKVNGESWGLYLAVELYNDSYEERVFHDTEGMLYNVKSMDMGANSQQLPGAPSDNQQFPGASGDNMKQFPGDSNHNTQQTPDARLHNHQEGVVASDSNQDDGSKAFTDNSDGPNNNNPGQWMNEIGKFGLSNFKNQFGSSGGSLEYTDDNIESYSAIFNNVVGKGTENDYRRVVEALKALSEGRDLETYFDVDKILRYLAAHTIVVNLDSYNSVMAQNYYIYEKDGKVTILPWDYNLAWGGYQSGDVSSVINFPIDTPVSGVEMSSRPLLEKLFSNTEYLDRYHNYLQQLLDNYFSNGKFEEKINSLDALISDYVKNDSTAFCTYEEYKTAVSAFIRLGNLRAQSVQGQLDGTIPSTTEAQKANPDQLISGEDLNLLELGSMMNVRGGMGQGAAIPNASKAANDAGTPNNFNIPGNFNMPDNFTPVAVGEQGTNRKNGVVIIGLSTILLFASTIVVSKFKRRY